jgi:chaperone BCS1
MPPSISSLVRHLSTALASDLSGQYDLVELTYILVLRNILVKVQRHSTKIDLILRIIVPYIVLFGGIYGTFSQVRTFREMITSLWNLVTAPFSSKITVPADHSLNTSVLAWLASRGLVADARNLALAEPRSRPSTWEQRLNINARGRREAAGPSSSLSPPLSFIPDFGKYRFRYKGHFMSMERRNDDGTDEHGRRTSHLDHNALQNLTLECFPTLRGTAPIQEFLQEVKRTSGPGSIAGKTTTTVYRSRDGGHDDPHWHGVDQRVAAIIRPARSIASVALETSKKNALVDDIAEYLTPECERFYANRGFPYRRGFLLYGPPGTGKTSFCIALAGHFHLDLYILSLSHKDMTDQHLEALFENLPTRCILLLEDVDSAGLEREKTKAELEKLYRATKNPAYRSGANHKATTLTLSGLLNCLDGPTSRDRRIVYMTSNAPDSLDPALIRPGRCDKKVLFGYANEEICIKLFEHLYTKTSEELAEGETSVSARYDVAQLAKAFAGAIPSDGKISPAEVQGYLMIHRRDRLAAVDGARAFAEDIIEVKARDKNVAEHANEIEKKEQSVAEFECDTDDIFVSEDSDESEEDSVLAALYP